MKKAERFLYRIATVAFSFLVLSVFINLFEFEYVLIGCVSILFGMLIDNKEV
jgi:hypothetical protein